MSNSLIDDSQESRGVTVDGTPLGVQARLSLAFDETTSEDVTVGAEVWRRVLQAIAGDKVHAEVTLKLDDADGSEITDGGHPQNTDGQNAESQNSDDNAIAALTFADVPVTLGIGLVSDEDSAGMHDASERIAPTKASLAGATIAEQQRQNEADKQQAQQEDKADDVYDVPRRAIIAMRSKTSDAEKRFRSAIVSLDAVPGNQVEGISPLYHVMGIDSSDASAAVIQLTTKLKPQAIVALLDSLSASHEGAVKLRLVDVEGETVSLQNTPQCDNDNIPDHTRDNAAENAVDSFVDNAAENAVDSFVDNATQDAAKDVAYAIELPLSAAKKQAEILAPWLDMDPDARLDGDPVSFLLAMAPDAARVGKVDDRWILGETQ